MLAPQWIDINEKLPPKDVMALVIWPNSFNGEFEIDVCRLYKGEGTIVFLDKYGDPNELITHWQPLPELPKKR